MSGSQTDSGASPRRCLCCGAATATRSIPACWEHWTLLPEDLRSSLVVTSSLGQLTQYADGLDRAVRLWREAGVWRPPHRVSFPRANASIRSADNVIPLTQRNRQTAASPLRPVNMLSRIATGTSDPRHPNPARAHTGTWGRGDVQTTVAAWHPTAIHCSRSDV